MLAFETDFNCSLSIIIHVIFYCVVCVHSGNNTYPRCAKYPSGFCIDGRNYTCAKGDTLIREDTGCKHYEICCVPTDLNSTVALPEPPNCGLPDTNPNSRIVGGTQTSIDKFPWQVSIYVKKKFVCGGTLISDTWVLTAAHCVDGYNRHTISKRNFMVGVGSTQRKERPLRTSRFRKVRLIVANKRHLTSKSHDIALLKLSKPINPKSRSTRPICIAPKEKPEGDFVKCVATGWGSVKEDSKKVETTLRAVKLSLFNQTTCSSKVPKMPPQTLCAGHPRGGKDTCWGDSGGPLACMSRNVTWFQVGITSLGHGCGTDHSLGVYTDLRAFYSWILKILKRFPDKI